MLGGVGWRGGDRSGRRQRGGGRGDVGDAAATADADAKTVALDLDFGQLGFVEKLRKFADQLLVDRGLVGVVIVLVGRHAQRLLFLFVIAARPSIASA